MSENRTARPTVALYVSGHGFGHAVRTAEVARELLARSARVLLRTEAPAWLFPEGVEHIPDDGGPIDVGVAQRDGLEMDLDETRRRWEVFGAELERRVACEADTLRRLRVHALLGDIPPLAFAAAARAAIPSAALANFGWDWIYAGWPGFASTIRQVQAGYRAATLLLRLPFHADEPDAFPAFQRVEDVPLIARRARLTRAEVRSRLDLPSRARVVLLSFGGFDTTRLDLAALGAWQRYLFVLTLVDSTLDGLPANVRVLPRRQVDYTSLLAACDAVVTKPGYGIVADSLANQVPVLYTDRGPFREYPVLVRALHALGRAFYVPHDDLRRGEIGPALDALLHMRTTWTTPRADGAAVVADRLLELAAPS